MYIYFYAFWMNLFLCCIAASAMAHDRLPLGDGKISAAPQRGFVMACDTHFPGGGGAHRVGDWVQKGYWQRSTKPVVEGKVLWPNASINIVRAGAWREVRANNLPTHSSGVFPVRPGSRAYDYDRNPNSIAEQDIVLKLPELPQPAATPLCVPMGMIGFATSGVAIFNAFDLAGRDAPAYEIQDGCNGHPERQGQYHYHDWSPCLKARDADAPVGWMLDGYPILGPVDGRGKVYHTADLDACHGQTGPVRLDGKIRVQYHYRFTADYPYTIGCFKAPPITAYPAAAGPAWR
jgi:hypothetical protein